MKLRLSKRLLGAAGALVAAALLAVTGLTAASAHVSAVPRTEHFQIMIASATATPVVIAHGVFTDYGVVANPGATVETYVLQQGSFRVAHKVTRSIDHFNPVTCLDQLSQTATYRVSHGTGRYIGIRGSGRFLLSLLAIEPRVSGKCSITAPPVAFQLIVKGSGPVSLP